MRKAVGTPGCVAALLPLLEQVILRIMRSPIGSAPHRSERLGMSQVVQKMCRVCGTDVANQKRTKDAAGNYYCQPCYEQAANPKANAATSRRCSCGAALDEDAAFCSRCGTKQEGNLSPNDEIDTTTIVVYIRRYGELEHALAMAVEADRQYREVRPQMVAAGAAAGAAAELAEIEELYAKGRATKAEYISECNDIKRRLEGFDHARVKYIRDLFLENKNVDASLKDGLRRDSFGIFDPVQDAKPRATQCAGAATANERPRTDDRSVILKGSAQTDGPRRVSFMPLVIGLGCLLLAAGFVVFAGSLAILFVPFLILGGCATILSWAIISVSRVLPRKRRVKPVKEADAKTAANPAKPFPVGLCVCIGMCAVGVVLLFLAGKRVYDASPPSDGDIHFVAITALTGIALLIVGFIGWSSACPHCHILFTAVVLDSATLGSHTETRRESRVARHYDARGGPAVAETRYDVDLPVQVTTLLNLKRCKSCGHEWLATERREH